jgi:tetratricopeptide (TPR) repeat protein
MKKQWIALVVLFGIASVSQAESYKEYGKYDLRNALKTMKLASGKQEYKVDMKYVGQVLDDLTAHAEDYPTKFRSKEEKSRAVRDAKLLQPLLDTLAAKENVDTQTLMTAAWLNSLAHNLDIEGAGQKAADYYAEVLDREPDNPRANYQYGIFLAGASKPKESLPYLEKALKLGVNGANYSLGLAYTTLGDNKKALEYLEAHARRNPNDKTTQELIQALKLGRLKTKTEQPATTN